MKKKLLALLVGICMVCTTIGCGSSTGTAGGVESAAASGTDAAADAGQADIQADKSSSGKKKTVTFYMWAADAEQEFDKAIVAQYEKEHPDIVSKKITYPMLNI